MANSNKPLDLGLQQDPKFQKHEWIAERIGWFFLYILLFLALLGFIGRGHFSSVSAYSSDNKLRVGYERFTRYQAPEELRFTIASEPNKDSIGLSLSSDFIDRIKVDDIQPTPVRVVSDPGWNTYVFAATANDPISVRFTVEHETFGSKTFRVQREGSQPLAINQFIYP